MEQELVDLEVADIMVTCPIPGVQTDPLTLREFALTEAGQRVVPSIVESFKILGEAGIKDEQAAIIALGAAALKDEDGNLMRSPNTEAKPVIQPELADSKKK